MKDGSWWVCGWNSLRQLGFGGTDGWFPSPKRLPFDFDPWAFAPGEGTTLLLGQDGQLGTWGWRWDDRMGMLWRYPAPELTVPIRH
jgi:alpha-tubulin suppressor-like RCC1 family protein